MRIHPPDLADLFPSSGRRGISFLEMLILSIKKDCSFLVERRNDGEVSPSFTPHLSYCAYFFPTFFLFLLPLPFLLYLSPYLFLILLCSCHLLPSLSWHLLSGSLIILFFTFLIRILSFSLSLHHGPSPCLCLCPPLSLPLALPHKHLTPIMFPFLLFLSLFSFLCRIQFSII